MPESEPDYLGPAFATIRQILIASKGLSDEDAANLLLEAWRADRRRDEEHLRDKAPKEVMWDDDKEIEDILRPCQYACNRLKDWKYVPLWYFCPEGHAEALTEECRKDASGFTRTDSGLACKQDHKLTWRQFDLAHVNFLDNIRSYNWPKRYIDSLSDFFSEVFAHHVRFKRGGERILLIYASRVRREWHDSLERGEGFNISIINKRLVRAITEDVKHLMEVGLLHGELFLPAP